MKVGDLVEYRGDFVIPRIFQGDPTRQPHIGIVVETIADQLTEGTNIRVFWFDAESSHWHTSTEIKMLNESR
tara:strand:+ start:511 stop:726 length:216 start_codon:yes stop_codon:yes gene_type:complete